MDIIEYIVLGMDAFILFVIGGIMAIISSTDRD